MRVCDTIAPLAQETPDFISSISWPPNIPDLNLVDYIIWNIMQETVCRHDIRDVDESQQHTVELWNPLHQSVIDSAIRQWRTRLQACVREKGRH